MTPEIHSIYDVLDLVRERPGMYGIRAKSLLHLQSFVAGLAFSDLDPGRPSFWDFPKWVTVRSGNVGTSMPWRWLETSQTDEQGYATWFELLDEYRQCREVELARVPGSILRPTFRRLDAEWKTHMPPIPSALVLGQFAPSSVFYLDEVYEEQAEKDYSGMRATREAAIGEALRRWGVDPAAWRR